jgi:hypothetical protein
VSQPIDAKKPDDGEVDADRLDRFIDTDLDGLDLNPPAARKPADPPPAK